MDEFLKQWRELIQQEARRAAEQVLSSALCQVEDLTNRARGSLQKADEVIGRAHSLAGFADSIERIGPKTYFAEADGAFIGNGLIEANIVDEPRFVIGCNQFYMSQMGHVPTKKGRYLAVVLLYRQP